MRRILFVCSGNTCRSPMAEFLLRQKLQQTLDGQLLPKYEIHSAGIFAGAGLPATHEAKKVMAERGVDLSTHRSQVLDQRLLDSSDLVLTMTESHRKHILSHFTIRPDKIYTLARFTNNEKVDVIDPFGSGIEAYRRTLDQLELLIEQVLELIL